MKKFGIIVLVGGMLLGFFLLPGRVWADTTGGPPRTFPQVSSLDSSGSEEPAETPAGVDSRDAAGLVSSGAGSGFRVGAGNGASGQCPRSPVWFITPGFDEAPARSSSLDLLSYLPSNEHLSRLTTSMFPSGEPTGNITSGTGGAPVVGRRIAHATTCSRRIIIARSQCVPSRVLNVGRIVSGPRINRRLPVAMFLFARYGELALPNVSPP